MIKEIVKDPIFLAQKSVPATKEDLSAAQDLLDTLQANRDRCVGMAANMIGISKRIIAFEFENGCFLMINPQIIKCSAVYETEEGYVVYCVDELGFREKRTVEVGISDGTTVEILSGLEENELVILD